MNLSEALDAALPDIPRAKLTRERPPCLDPELIVREDTVDGEPIVGAFQRRGGNYFRFQPLQWQLAQLFDGTRSYEEIAALFNEASGAEITAAEVKTFAQNMDEVDFWYRTPQERNIALYEKLTAQRLRRVNRTSKFNIAHMTFSGWDPDRYLTRLDDLIGKAVYSGWSVTAALLLFCFEAVVFARNWHVIGPDIPLYYNFAHKSFLDLAQFWILFLVIGFFHETAHGLTCKHYGGEVHRMGLMFIYLTPAFFVDITETWISATRLQRLATIIAGIWIEMIFCGFAMLAWTNTLPGQWLHDFSYQVILITGVAVIVVNLNPLIKLDGYYFLTETIGIPDLKERSTAFLSGWFQSHILRLPVETPVVARRRVLFFIIYAVVSATYSYLLLFFVIRFTYNIGSRWLAEFALIPAGALAFAIFRSRLRSLADVLRRFWAVHFPAIRSRKLPVLSIAAALCVLLFMPLLRDRENAFFLIEPNHSFNLHASSSGQIEQVLVREGELVHKGQPLLQLVSPAVDSLQADAASKTAAASFAAFTAQVNRQTLGTTASDVNEAAHSSSLGEEARRRLVLEAPTDGIILTQDPDALLHQQIGSGQSLLTLADSGPRVARLFVPVTALDRLTAAHPPIEVELAPPGSFSFIHVDLPTLQGDAVTLPPGVVALQDYKGVRPPAYYSARVELPAAGRQLPLGTVGEAKIYGTRQSLFQRGLTVVFDVARAHLW